MCCCKVSELQCKSKKLLAQNTKLLHSLQKEKIKKSKPEHSARRADVTIGAESFFSSFSIFTMKSGPAV
jgi:hypothetical protein